MKKIFIAVKNVFPFISIIFILSLLCFGALLVFRNEISLSRKIVGAVSGGLSLLFGFLFWDRETKFENKKNASKSDVYLFVILTITFFMIMGMALGEF